MKSSYIIVVSASADENIIGLKEEIAARLEGIADVKIISISEDEEND